MVAEAVRHEDAVDLRGEQRLFARAAPHEPQVCQVAQQAAARGGLDLVAPHGAFFLFFWLLFV